MRKYKAPSRSVKLTTHLRPHLAQYVEGLAKIHNMTMSATLAVIVERDLQATAKKVKEKIG